MNKKINTLRIEILVKVWSIDEGVETSAASKMAEGALPLHVNMYLREHFP